jgi:anti-anti-sigma regulatory factor
LNLTLIGFSFRTLDGKRRAKSLSAKTRDLAPRTTRYLASDAIYGVETKITSRRSKNQDHLQEISSSNTDNNLAVVATTDAAIGPGLALRSARKEVKMTTKITRIEGERASEMVLKLEGVLTVADAKLLEEICEDIRRELDHSITIDLSGVNYLGTRSAEVIRRLRTIPGLSIEGAHLFVQQILEATEDGNHHE